MTHDLTLEVHNKARDLLPNSAFLECKGIAYQVVGKFINYNLFGYNHVRVDTRIKIKRSEHRPNYVCMGL